MASPSSAPLDVSQPDRWGRVRGWLSELPYDGAALKNAGCEPPLASAKSAALALFHIGQSLSAADARRALGAIFDDLLAVRLLELDGDAVRGAGSIVARPEFLILSDWNQRGVEDRAADYVMGIGGSTLRLWSYTIRRPVGEALDLGTGCGTLAVLAARHANRVTAVDFNPRAANFAAANMLLNGRSNVELLVGDFFEPVKDRAFDLIVSNPPFVISPARRFIYRDGSEEADGLCRRLTREGAARLSEGGFLQMLVHWAVVRGEPWRQRIAQWAAGTGCDAFVLHLETHEPGVYANIWLKHTEGARPSEFAEHFQQWTDYYRRLNIEALCGGFITLRKRAAGPNWFSVDDAPASDDGSCGEDLVRRFRAIDFLQSARDWESLAAARLRPAPDLRMKHQFECHRGEWRLSEVCFAKIAGLCYEGGGDLVAAQIVGLCDGATPLGQIVRRVAEEQDLPPESLAAAVAEPILAMIERGYLLPPGCANVTGGAEPSSRDDRPFTTSA